LIVISFSFSMRGGRRLDYPLRRPPIAVLKLFTLPLASYLPDVSYTSAAEASQALTRGL
jgi:hypothetical protein